MIMFARLTSEADSTSRCPYSPVPRHHGLDRNPPWLLEAVKKFRRREMVWPVHVRGRARFTPPKQALISPRPAKYFIQGDRSENPFVPIKIFSGGRRRSAEDWEALHGHPSPAGFWRRESGPPPDNEKGYHPLRLNFFVVPPFIKGGWGRFQGKIAHATFLMLILIFHFDRPRDESRGFRTKPKSGRSLEEGERWKRSGLSG